MDFREETITSEGEIMEDLREDMASDWNLKEQVELGVVGLEEAFRPEWQSRHEGVTGLSVGTCCS